MRFFVLTLLVVGSLVGGRADGQTVLLDTVRFAPALEVDLPTTTRLKPGLHYRDLAVGTGRVARRGSELTVRFEGWRTDGASFTGPPTEPLTFRLGRGLVVDGWERGLVGVQAGGRRQLVMTPAYGYRHERVGPVPENSVLVFMVDVISVR